MNGTARPSLRVRLAAEGLGTLLLVAAVIGSGIMGARLTGDTALVLLANSLATAAILVVLVTILLPVSGAHINPAVSVVLAIRGELPRGELVPYLLAQFVGALAGAAIAHLMFEQPPLTLGVHPRFGVDLWLAEAVATFTLLLAILGGLRFRPEAVPWLVGLAIGSAYWFTASTSFANPAVTLGRAFTATFTGIVPAHAPAFMLAQIAGALVAMAAAAYLFGPPKR